jgi:hypothetical protein
MTKLEIKKKLVPFETSFHEFYFLILMEEDWRRARFED